MTTHPPADGSVGPAAPHRRRPRRLLMLLPAMLAVGLGAWIALGGAAASDVAERVAAAQQSAELLSPVYHIDRKYRSMEGPYDVQDVRLAAGEGEELLWITGYRAVMVGADGETPMAQDFMCHSNLDLDLDAHRDALGLNPSFSSRLFTLSQGQLEVDFPAGFGIPVLSSEVLSLTTQVLNHNLEGASLDVRHKVHVDYVSDRAVGDGMKALFPTSAYGLALLEGDAAYFGVGEADAEEHGPGCLVSDNASDSEYEDGMGRKFTGHWVVKPGREINHTLVTHLMRVPYDTRIHYVAVHLHPFAESLELRDLTTGETLFKSRARNHPDRIGLAHVDAFSSAEGVPVYDDHEYEVVSVYDNTTGEPQDSMAVLYLYLHDLEFDRRWTQRQRRVAGSAEVATTAPRVSE